MLKFGKNLQMKHKNIWRKLHANVHSNKKTKIFIIFINQQRQNPNFSQINQPTDK